MGNNISVRGNYNNICRGNSVCQIFLSPSTDDIEDNRSSIEDNGLSIEDNRLAIDKNSESIDKNKKSIEENILSIDENKESIEENGSSIEENESAALLNRNWIIGLTIVLILTLLIYVISKKIGLEKFFWNLCRIKLIVLNSLAMLVFFTIVAISIKDNVIDKSGNHHHIENLWQNPSIIIIGLFTFLAIFSFCGCCGACVKNNCMLGIFITILVIFLSTNVVGIIFLYQHHDGELPFLKNKYFRIVFWAIPSLMMSVLISSCFVCLRKKANNSQRRRKNVEEGIELQQLHHPNPCAPPSYKDIRY